MQDAKIRLYVEQPLAPGQAVALSRDQAHYLFNVMRLGAGAPVLLFNGQDGEWRAEVAVAGKHGGVLTCEAQARALQAPPDLWLLRGVLVACAKRGISARLLAGETNYDVLRPDVWKQAHPEAIRIYRVEERQARADAKSVKRA